MAIIRSGWVLPPRTVMELLPFDFATVSGCVQLVVGPTHARGGTLDLLMTDVPDLVWVAVVAPLGSWDHSISSGSHFISIPLCRQSIHVVTVDVRCPHPAANITDIFCWAGLHLHFFFVLKCLVIIEEAYNYVAVGLDSAAVSQSCSKCHLSVFHFPFSVDYLCRHGFIIRSIFSHIKFLTCLVIPLILAPGLHETFLFLCFPFLSQPSQVSCRGLTIESPTLQDMLVALWGSVTL